MNNKARIQILFNPKTVSFGVGGALIGYFLFRSVEATIIGGVLGTVLSLIK